MNLPTRMNPVRRRIVFLRSEAHPTLFFVVVVRYLKSIRVRVFSRGRENAGEHVPALSRLGDLSGFIVFRFVFFRCRHSGRTQTFLLVVIVIVIEIRVIEAEDRVFGRDGLGDVDAARRAGIRVIAFDLASDYTG